MTDAEKITFTQTLVNDSRVTEDVASTYLTLAAGRIVERCYPWGDGTETMPPKYDLLQCELASRMIFRRGFEGETVSIENGVHRHFDSVNDEDLMAEVVQYVGVM